MTTPEELNLHAELAAVRKTALAQMDECHRSAYRAWFIFWRAVIMSFVLGGITGAILMVL